MSKDVMKNYLIGAPKTISSSLRVEIRFLHAFKKTRNTIPFQFHKIFFIETKILH